MSSLGSSGPPDSDAEADADGSAEAIEVASERLCRCGEDERAVRADSFPLRRASARLLAAGARDANESRLPFIGERASFHTTTSVSSWPLCGSAFRRLRDECDDVDVVESSRLLPETVSSPVRARRRRFFPTIDALSPDVLVPHISNVNFFLRRHSMRNAATAASALAVAALAATVARTSTASDRPSAIADATSGTVRFAVRGALSPEDDVECAGGSGRLTGRGPFVFRDGRLHRRSRAPAEGGAEPAPRAAIQSDAPSQSGVVQRTCYGCGAAAAVAAASYTEPRRAVCASCATTSIRTAEQGEALLAEVVHDLHRFIGLDLRGVAVPLRLVGECEDDAWELDPDSGERRDPVDASAAWAELPLLGGVAVRKLVMLKGLPRLHSGKMLAHELTHVWIHRGFRSLAPLPPRVEEGLCELVAYLWLVERAARLERGRGEGDQACDADRRVALWRIAQTERNPDALYGGGLRACLASAQGRPLHAVLEHVRRHKRLPAPREAHD